MPTQLHVIYPAEEYVEGGTVEPVDLICTSGAEKIEADLKRVVLLITAEPFSVTEVPDSEVHPWQQEYVTATKIIDSCSGQEIYVAEEIKDVFIAMKCCLTIPPGPPQPPVSYQYFWAWLSSNPYNDLISGLDSIVYQGSAYSTQTATDITANYSPAPLYQYYVLKTRKELPIFNHYTNSLLIFGPIPDPVWYPYFEIGDYRYYVTRWSVAFALNKLTHFLVQ